jgi:DNA-binding NarL/FixJ family response regulator
VLKDLQYTFYELKKAIQGLKQEDFYLDSKIRMPREHVPVAQHADPINDLNSYERKITRLTYAGKTIKEISVETGKSPKTVEKYRSDIYVKLGVKNAIELVKFIALHNLVV